IDTKYEKVRKYENEYGLFRNFVLFRISYPLLYDTLYKKSIFYYNIHDMCQFFLTKHFNHRQVF
ncbi:MAG: hypothetical protein WC862_02825, partial [Patescibacteria group bacterium]